MKFKHGDKIFYVRCTTYIRQENNMKCARNIFKDKTRYFVFDDEIP